MAARKRRVKLDDAWRQKIRTSMLINRLQDHAFANLQDPKVNRKKGMSRTQVQAIEILLRKVAPDLVRTTLEGDKENPLSVDSSITIVPVRPAAPGDSNG